MLKDAGLEPPIDALCRGCGYSLRGLNSGRCPECGRAFEASDPRTMNLGWRHSALRRTLIGPVSHWAKRGVVVGSTAILWGAAWLPGAGYVFNSGWVLLLACVCYWIGRRLIRWLLRWHYSLERLSRPRSERYSRWQLLMIALAMSAPIGNWPLRVNLLAHRPLLDRFGWHTYAEAPLLKPPATPRIVGLFVITSAVASPGGTEFAVFGAGEMHYRPDNPDYDPAHYSRGAVPSYLNWMLPPGSGPWHVVPTTPGGAWLWLLQKALDPLM